MARTKRRPSTGAEPALLSRSRGFEQRVGGRRSHGVLLLGAARSTAEVPPLCANNRAPTLVVTQPMLVTARVELIWR